MICDHCGKDCEELVTRSGFCMTFYVEWVCESCFKILEGESFEEYGRDDDVQTETRN